MGNNKQMQVGDKVYLRSNPTQVVIIREIHEPARTLVVSLFGNSVISKKVRFDDIDGYNDVIGYSRTRGKYIKNRIEPEDDDKPKVVVRTVPHTQKQIEILKELGLEHLIKQ